uniref:Uncharacterized protein n=1 Tax=Arundo donax TaxID=35708 RepID=A0A0A9DS17_ARUDO
MVDKCSSFWRLSWFDDLSVVSFKTAQQVLSFCKISVNPISELTTSLVK